MTDDKAPALDPELIDLTIEFSSRNIKSLYSLCLTSRSCLRSAQKLLYREIAIFSGLKAHELECFEIGGPRFRKWQATMTYELEHDHPRGLLLHLTTCNLVGLLDPKHSEVLKIIEHAVNLKRLVIAGTAPWYWFDRPKFRLTSFAIFDNFDISRLEWFPKFISFFEDQLPTLEELIMASDSDHDNLASAKMRLLQHAKSQKLTVLGGDAMCVSESLPLMQPHPQDVIWIASLCSISSASMPSAFFDSLSHITSLTLATGPPFVELAPRRPQLTELCDYLHVLEVLQIHGNFDVGEIDGSLGKLTRLRELLIFPYEDSQDTENTQDPHQIADLDDPLNAFDGWFAKCPSLLVLSISVFRECWGSRIPSESWKWIRNPDKATEQPEFYHCQVPSKEEWSVHSNPRVQDFANYVMRIARDQRCMTVAAKAAGWC